MEECFQYYQNRLMKKKGNTKNSFKSIDLKLCTFSDFLKKINIFSSQGR